MALVSTDETVGVQAGGVATVGADDLMVLGDAGDVPGKYAIVREPEVCSAAVVGLFTNVKRRFK